MAILFARSRHTKQKVLQESTETTVGRVLAARPGLREEAEVEVAMETAAAASSGGGAHLTVPSLEELVAEKAEELRTRLQHSQGGGTREEAVRVKPPPSTPPSAEQGDDARERPDAARQQAEGGPLLPPVAVAGAGWPWPAEWLAAPRVPPPPPSRGVDILGPALEGSFVDLGDGGGDRGRLLSGPEDGGGTSGPPIPYSIEVAAVEVADAEDPDAAHVEVRCGVLFTWGEGACVVFVFRAEAAGALFQCEHDEAIPSVFSFFFSVRYSNC